MKTFKEYLAEEHPMYKMDPHTFDQSEKGWRSLPEKEQTRVLSGYIRKHIDKNKEFKKTAPQGQKSVDPRVLHWHLGQTYAMNGNNKKAIHHMKKSLSNDDHQWNSYAHATMSFIKGDKASFDKHASGDNYNKDTLDRLSKGFGKPYRDAY